MKKNLFLLFLISITSISITQAQSILKNNVHFKSDVYTLEASEKEPLQALLNTIANDTECHLQIVGHTDQDGAEAYNLELSKKRAEAVKKYFLDHGFSSSHIEISYLGESDLVNTSTDADSKKQNRRVSIIAERYNYTNVEEMVILVEKEDNDTHTVDQDMESSIQLKKGTQVNIPSNAFCHLDGTPLESQKIDLFFKEAFDYTHMVDERLFTQTADQWLETGGMIYIEASQNGVPVKLQEGKSIELLFPEQEAKDGMELFTGTEDENGIIWKETGEEISSVKSDENRPFIQVDLTPILDLEIEDDGYLPLSFGPMPPYPHPVKMPYPPYRNNYSDEDFVLAQKKYEEALAAFEKDKIERPAILKEWKAEAQRRKNILIDHKKNYVRSTVKDMLKERVGRLRMDQDRISHDKLINVLFSFLDKGVGKIDYNDFHYTKLAFGQYVVQARKEIGPDFPDFKYTRAAYFFPEFNDGRTDIYNSIAERMYELGYVDDNVMARYTVNTGKLGWINCDIFYKLAENEKTDLEFASLTDKDQFYLVFKGRKSLIRPRMTEGRVLFRGLPKGEEVRLVAVNIKDGKARMAQYDFTIDSKVDVSLKYAPVDIKELRKVFDI